MRKILLGLLALGIASSMVSCGKYPGYKKSDNGLLYKIIKKGKGTVKPQVDDWLWVQFKVRSADKDTVLFGTKKSMPVRVSKTSHKGDFEEIFQLASVGDSASCLSLSDSLIKYYRFELPEKLRKNKMIRIDIRVDSITTKAQYEKQLAEYKKQEEVMMAKLKAGETDSLAKYIKDNKITVKPNSDGIYIIPIKKGNGKQLAEGKTVQINYQGWTIDGRMFDTSIEEAAKKNEIYVKEKPYQPIAVHIGKGEVIKGWDLVLPKLKVGDKVKLIIPSSLGYGERGAGNGFIMPYSTLIFEIEVMEMVD